MFNLCNRQSRLMTVDFSSIARGMFTQPDVDVEFNILSISNPCQLNDLAVGFGGFGNFGGGGSGFIQYVTQTITSIPTNIRLTVGDNREASTVNIAGKTFRGHLNCKKPSNVSFSPKFSRSIVPLFKVWSFE